MKMRTVRGEIVNVARKATKEDGYGKGFLVLSSGKIVHKSMLKPFK